MVRKQKFTKKFQTIGEDLTAFACPNEDCLHFNQFAAGNLSICERMGKNKSIRRKENQHP